MSSSRFHASRQTVSSMIDAIRMVMAKRGSYTMICVVFLLILHQFSLSLLQVPKVQIFENLICYRQQLLHDKGKTGDGDEWSCKTPSVQGQLASLLGLRMAFDAIPGIVVAPLLGSLADRKGRKPVVLLALLGEFLSLLWILVICYLKYHVGLLYCSSLFLFIGGGQRLFLSMLFSIISDTVDAKIRTRFMYINPGLGAIASVVAPLVAERLLAISPWVPFYVAGAIGVTSFIIALCLPGATRKAHLLPPDTITTDNSVEDVDAGPTDESYSSPTDQDTPLLPQENSHDLPTVAPLILNFNPLFTTPLKVCYSIAFLKRIAFSSQDFVYQYVSRVFKWSLRHTAQLQLSKAIGATSIVVLVLPALSTYIIRRRILLSERLDLVVLRFCAIFAFSGPLLFWLATSSFMLYSSMLVWGLGEGMEPVLQGISAFLVDPNYTARMFTTVARVELCSKLFAGPLMGSLLLITRNGEILVEGACFPVAVLLFGIIVVLALSLRTDLHST